MAINSIEDLPEYVKQYARMWKNYPNDIIIVFPYPSSLTEADIKKIPAAKKFIKANGGGYDDRGHWRIPLSSNGKGWHEEQRPTPTTKGIRNIAPEHYAASKKNEFKNTLRQPLVMVNDNSNVKIVDKAIEAMNPIEQFQAVRYKYQGKYTVIRETFQNSARAGADTHKPVDVIMTFTKDMYKIEDTGGGVTKANIDLVFRMGKSGWKTLGAETNPFGEGFLSFMLLFGKAEVISNDVNAEFDWDWIEQQYKTDKNFDIRKAYKVAEYGNDTELKAKDKFIAIFTKPLPHYDPEKAIKVAKIIAQTIPVNSITINGEKVTTHLDFETPPSGYIKIEKKYGDKPGIIGWFHPSVERDYIRVYFQGNPVGSISDEVVNNYYRDLPAMNGIVNVLHTYYGDSNQSRDAWLDNGAFERTEKYIRELAKDAAINYVKYASDSAIDKLEHFISAYATFDEIKYHIRFNVIEPEVLEQVTKVERELHKEMDEQSFKVHMAGIMKSPSQLIEAIERAKNYSQQLDQTAYNEKQKQLLDEKAKLNEERAEQGLQIPRHPSPSPQPPEQQQAEGRSEETEIEGTGKESTDDEPFEAAIEEKEQVINEKLEELEQQKTTQEQKRKTVDEKIDEYLETREQGGTTFANWKKETFWCDRRDVEEYADSIKMAGYYHINVAIAENKFQRQGFESFDNFHHISELESSMSIVPTLTSTGARNAQERRIEWIIKVFLDASGYKDVKLVIANISARRVLTIGATRKKVDENIEVEAYAEHQTNTIYFQRTINYGMSGDGTVDYTGIKALYPYLTYNDFPTDSKSIGQGDIAVFSKVRKVLSHELAHLKYKTKDDTADHYKYMVIIDTVFDKTLAEFKASSKLTDSLTGLSKKVRERLGVQKGDTMVVTVTKGATGQFEKQEYTSIRKTTLKDLFINPMNKNLFTYKQLIERYDNIDSLQKEINNGTFKFTGYKIGDRVQINEDNKEIIATIKTTNGMTSIGVEVDGKSAPPYSYYTMDEVAKLLERKVHKYKMGEIFMRKEDGYVQTYKDILKYYESGDAPIGFGKYKRTGLKVGDSIPYRKDDLSMKGKIKGVWSGQLIMISERTGIEFYRDVSDLPNFKMPEPEEPEYSHEPDAEEKDEPVKKQVSIEDLL